MSKTIKINVPSLARVEGEGALDLTIEDNKIKSLELQIYEPPRLFEKFLQGRDYTEIVDIVARICGICPVAYQMTAVNAIENAFNVDVSNWTQQMRQLYYCGEWIESHSLHIHLLAVPDFFGYDSAIAMAKKYPREIQRGMRLQSAGNAIMSLLGMRSVHPVGACVGGFYQAPSLDAVSSLLRQLYKSKEDAEELLAWVAGISFPDVGQEFTSVALQSPGEYAVNQGNIASDKGLNIAAHDFEKFFQEEQVAYSTALHCKLQNQPYLVGPLARMNLNHHFLPTSIREVMKDLDSTWPSKNMFHCIIARAVEILFAITKAINFLENYQLPVNSKVDVTPKKSVGYGCTEAPRGLLWHRYDFDENGLIKKANIVPPTSQNQARIEEDIKQSLEKYGLDHSEKELRLHSEMVIRNYDPCISCSTHFLDCRVERL